MASTRIFIRGLPPTMTEAECRKHFSARNREITDLRLFSKRRMGYVGYKTAEDAQGAVKYFNKSFIRMSRLAVELATPVSQSTPGGRQKPTAPSPVPLAARTVAPSQDGRKRKRATAYETDQKLKEYLQVLLPNQAPGTIHGDLLDEATPEPILASVLAKESDDEYEDVRLLKRKRDTAHEAGVPDRLGQGRDLIPIAPPISPPTGSQDTPFTELPSAAPAPASSSRVPRNAPDDEWLRSRTNRVLDLVGFDPAAADPPVVLGLEKDRLRSPSPAESNARLSDCSDREAANPPEVGDDTTPGTHTEVQSRRIFVRNLPFTATADDLRQYFEPFGFVDDVHLSVDKQGSPKGFAFVSFLTASSALEALEKLDGNPFQGRLLHILPAQEKKSRHQDDFSLSKLPLKTQNILRKRAQAASTTFNWNSLFMNQDAVNTAVAERLGVSKSELLDPTSSEAAVKQAIAETNVIQETKAYFSANGVDLDAFKSRKRGDTTILVKNFPHGTSVEQIRIMFDAHGSVLRVLMPPSGTIAIVQFAQASQAKIAFAKLAYTRIQDSILFLEKGPSDLFANDTATVKAVVASLSDGSKPVASEPIVGVPKPTVNDLLKQDEEAETDLQTSSLFVKNLAFATTSSRMESAFKPLDGFVAAKVKTKTDVKRPGEVLSLGFGFVEFRTKENALVAQKAMDGFVLDGHVLQVKVSHKGLDAAEERRREDQATKRAAKHSKIIIKNLPFETTKKDVRALFGNYGQLKAVRVPKKFDRSRGFGFVEFLTAREAELAFNALRDTHLLGRKMVLDYAEAEAVDPEEEIARMQRKIEGQVNKMALQRLTDTTRTKVTLEDGEMDAELP